ncbi:MAG: hypothetical protein NTV34_13480, partial [Proteobacteria bacterium]|nr:hypothetical protein [Pseudomonadota bacterium]
MKKIVISQSALRLAALTIVGSAVSCGIWEKTKPGDRGVLGEGQVSNGNAEVPQPPLTDINNSSSSKPEVLSPKSQESGLICEAYLKRSNLPIYRDYVQASPMENPLIEDIPPVLEKEDELFRPFFKLMESRVSEVSPLTPEIFTLAKNAMIAAHKFIYVFNWQPNYPRADHAAGEMNWVPSVPPAAEQINNWKMERTGTNWVASYSRDRETKMIFSQGDFDANNQDRCIIFVNGNLTAKTIKYCTIIASGNVHVDSLIDSSVMAGGEVTGSVPQYEVYINNNKGAVAASSDKLVKDPKIAQGYFYSLSKPEVLRHISNYHQGPESTRYSFRDAYFFEKKHLVVNNVTGRWDICTGLQMNGGAGWQECHDVRDFKRYSARKISFRDGSFIKLGGKDLKFEVYDQNAKLVSSIDIAKYSKLFSSSIKVESDE